MQTIRRFYLYAVAFVSLEAVLWGIIGLARSFFSQHGIKDSTNLLAGGLALLLVGVPVLCLHGWLAQRGALRDTDERSARSRAVFLYGVLLATLLPAVQNLLALLDRALLDVMGVELGKALIGADQMASDNLIAIAANLLAAAGAYAILHADWRAMPRGDAYPEMRRLYRYIWLIYGLAMLIFGAQQILSFGLTFWRVDGEEPRAALANGLALLAIGAPLWLFVRYWIERSLAESNERNSALRLLVHYVVAFVSLSAAMLASVGALAALAGYPFNLALGVKPDVDKFFDRLAITLPLALPLLAAWAYTFRKLVARPKNTTEAAEAGDALEVWRAGLQRLYHYILALLGLGMALIGLEEILAMGLDVVVGDAILKTYATLDRFALGFALLLVGAPLWVAAWRPMQAEAAREGEAGDRARRLTVRRGYLFLVLFTGVVGVMVGIGMLLYEVLLSLLGEASQDLLLQTLQSLKLALIFAGLLGYHGWMLRADGRRAQLSLSKRHAQFPVLILAPDDGEFAAQFVSALRQQAPNLPVAVHPYSQGAPDETLSAARLVILPTELLARPTEALRLWLQAFSGQRLVVPTPVQDWHWILGGGRPLSVLASQTARAVVHLAEGEAIPVPSQSTPWMTIVYLFAALFGLELIWGILALLLSLLGD